MMGSRLGTQLFDILHFVRDLLFPLLKILSLDPIWSAPLRDYPAATAHSENFLGELVCSYNYTMRFIGYDSIQTR